MTGGGAPPKQGFTVYTMMLIVSLIALVTGATLLYQELQKYGSYPQWSTNEARAVSGS